MFANLTLFFFRWSHISIVLPKTGASIVLVFVVTFVVIIQ